MRMTRPSCHRFPSNEVRLRVSVKAYNLRNLLAASGDAERNREVVADVFLAAAGQDRKPSGQACPVLLIAAGREPSEVAVVGRYGGRPCSRPRNRPRCSKSIGRQGGTLGDSQVQQPRSDGQERRTCVYG